MKEGAIDLERAVVAYYQAPEIAEPADRAFHTQRLRYRRNARAILRGGHEHDSSCAERSVRCRAAATVCAADGRHRLCRRSPASNANGKVGTIGYCSGGRQSFLAAVSLQLDAAVDCYGAFVTGEAREGTTMVPIVDKTPSLSCPLLGLFGNDDQYPSPAQVDELEEALKANGKTYEFHRYTGAGHAFFAVNRPAYRPEAATDGWQKIFAFYGRYLSA